MENVNMNKQNKKRLEKALQFINKMNENEFEEFLIDCSPDYIEVNHNYFTTDYNDIELIESAEIIVPANDEYYCDTLSEAA